jgi:hypothetical protein
VASEAEVGEQQVAAADDVEMELPTSGRGATKKAKAEREDEERHLERRRIRAFFSLHGPPGLLVVLCLIIFLGLEFDVDELFTDYGRAYPFRSRCILFYSLRYPISRSG